jgi:hypothetical protein
MPARLRSLAEGRRRIAVFAALAVLLVLVEVAVTRSASFARGGAVPVAVFVDLFVVLPLLFVVTALRPARRPLLDVAPAVALGAAAAGLLLATRPETRTLVRGAAALAEGLVLALFVRRVRTAAREARAGADADADVMGRLHGVTDPRMRVLALELAVLYFAVIGPWVRRPVRAGEHTVSESSGLGGLLLALAAVAALEGVAVHLVLHTWSAPAAWAASALNAYALVWLMAAYQAARLRRVTVTPEHLVVRTSLLWTAEVPRRAIVSITPTTEARREAGLLRAAFGAPPCLLVTLSEPVAARGVLGITKLVTRIALYVDDPGALRDALGR